MGILAPHLFRKLGEELLSRMVMGRVFRKHIAAFKREHSLDEGYFFKFHTVKYGFAYKQEYAFGMVDYMLGILHIEIMKNRDYYRTVSDSCHIGHDP